MNVLISTSSFGKHSREPIEMLEAGGLEYRLNPYGRKLSAGEIAALLSDVDGLIAGTEPLTREVLERAQRLKAISRCGVGMDNVDLEAAAELGIAVRNTPDAHVDGVAELALAGMLAVLRHITQASQSVRAGEWSKPMGRLLRGKIVGLVGLGRVGRRLVDLLAPFQVSLLASDPCKNLEFATRHAIEYTDLDELLERADIVSLHLPYVAEIRHLIDRARLERMKPGAVLINCARGGIVDEAALYHLLREGRLGGAHLDCFEREPYEGPLSELSNVVMTPHIGSYAAEGRVQMEREAVANLIDCLRNGRRSMERIA